ncbi:hypothetical protein GCM10011494_26380 [Novosphingobium endophyticum]|uniref:Uncharacterized protein n=1 Tax=Novosphingobium endophyticum TaxID=1955250 RepID=A0A916X672_9SPHN|nr:hypothetical protein GCM10011494_26380 [Novosphingobium endophyticum]
MRSAHRHQAPCQIAPPERHRVQEAQGRNRAIDGARTGAALVLVDLEIAQILRRRRVGRTAEVGGKAPDVADVLFLRARQQARKASHYRASPPHATLPRERVRPCWRQQPGGMPAIDGSKLRTSAPFDVALARQRPGLPSNTHSDKDGGWKTSLPNRF